jgi:iron complex outermembrane receptor protein
LPTEVAYGADVSLRLRRSRFAGEATLFVNRVDRYIFPFQTGDVDDEGFTVVTFRSADSRFRAGGRPLPRIPSRRLWVGLRFEHGPLHFEGEVKNVGEQTRVYGAETPTEGYTLLNFHGSYQLTTGRTVHTFTLRADNVGGEIYRNHLSYIKDLALEPGRSFKLVYGVRF